MGTLLIHRAATRASLVLLRHGESTANAAGLFTGVLDVGLSRYGIQEAQAAARMLRRDHFTPDHVYTSELVRTKQSADVIVSLRPPWPVAVTADWRLNERNYGSLTGRSKRDVLEEFGDRRFRTWRRSVDIAPPPMAEVCFQKLATSEPFVRLPPQALTHGESLREVIDRVSHFLTEQVVPDLLLGRAILVIAHGNSLRALCAVLDSMDDDAVERLNIPTGQPLSYKFDEQLRPFTRGGSYIDPENARLAATRLANEGGT